MQKIKTEAERKRERARERELRRERRKVTLYSPYQTSNGGKLRLSLFAYPLEKAQRVFADVLTKPGVELAPADTTEKMPVPGLGIRTGVTPRYSRIKA